MSMAWILNQTTNSEFTDFMEKTLSGMPESDDEIASYLAESYQKSGWSGVEDSLHELLPQFQNAIILVTGTDGRKLLAPKEFKFSHIVENSELIGVHFNVVSDNTEWNLGTRKETAIPIVSSQKVIGHFYRINGPGGLYAVAEKQFTDAVATTAALLVLSLIPISLVFAYFVGRRITRPLEELATACNELGTGSLGYQVAVSGDDEVAVLARHFNQMSNELKIAQENRRQMISDTAHELRTPLTGVRCAIEAVKDGVSELSEERVDGMLNDVVQLQRLVSDLQEMTLAASGELKLSIESVDLAELIKSAGTSLNFEDRLDVNIQADSGQYRVRTDPLRLRQIFQNLFQNSLSHSEGPCRVDITFKQTSDHIHIKFSDNGPGVTTSELPHLFERLYQGYVTHNSGSGGSGLGLGISRALTELLGGEIEARTGEPDGLCFILIMPLSFSPRRLHHQLD